MPWGSGMTDEEAQGAGVAAWMVVRMMAGELAASGVVPPKRMRKLVSGLLEQVTELDRMADLSAEARGTARRRLEELRRSAELNPPQAK